MSDIQWLNYLFFTDFTSNREVLSAIPAGVVDEHNATMLAASLSEHDKGQYRANWTDQPGTEFSVAGVEVVYTSLPTNGLYKYTLILKFPSTSTAPSGRIVLQYNDAPPPAVEIEAS